MSGVNHKTNIKGDNEFLWKMNLLILSFLKSVSREKQFNSHFSHIICYTEYTLISTYSGIWDHVIRFPIIYPWHCIALAIIPNEYCPHSSHLIWYHPSIKVILNLFPQPLFRVLKYFTEWLSTKSGLEPFQFGTFPNTLPMNSLVNLSRACFLFTNSSLTFFKYYDCHGLSQLLLQNSLASSVSGFSPLLFRCPVFIPWFVSNNLFC